MIRRLSTKWLLAVLASVVLPFVGFAWYVDVKLADRLSNDIVRYHLLRFAADLADRIDDELGERRLDVELLASDPLVLASARSEGRNRAPMLEASLERIVRLSTDFDLLLVVGLDGRCIAASVGTNGDPGLGARLHQADLGATTWFQEARLGQGALVDQHVSPILHDEALAAGTLDLADARSYGVGIAEPIRDADNGGEVLGVVYGVLNWGVIQLDFLDSYRGVQNFDGIGSTIYASSYSWLWKADANTIIGHPQVELYGQLVSEPPVELPQLVAAARASDWGMYPEYEFGGQMKQAAFKHCRGPERNGFGWIVGIGIDNTDIYAVVNELNRLLINASLLVLLVVVTWTVIIARRTTRPLLELRQHTRRVASGDLDARIEVRSADELGELARAFNLMTEELAENRAKLVRAEKESAWREMARQVAHEIKNPLTPISLSANLLRRARDENSPEFDTILDRTVDLMLRQVENLRQISQNFYAFAGERQLDPQPTDLRALVDEIMELNTAWAQELGVRVTVSGEAPDVLLDATEFKRVLINLVSNALESMPEGGLLHVGLHDGPRETRIDVRDTGGGIDEEVSQRLFEPYFTTRSHGTGLGLAICKRVIDEMGGSLSLEPVSDEQGEGTRAIIRLPNSAARPDS